MPEDSKIGRPAADDYRTSHVDKGADYDSSLATSPFDAFMTKCETHWLTQFVRQRYPERIPRYLDFACGTGRITQIVAPLAREAVGVDVSASMLAVARAKCPQADFVLADLTTGGAFKPESFDVVTAFRFFGNAQRSLRVAALAAIARVLRPGGHLLLNSHRNPLALASLLHTATGGAHGMDLHYFKLRRLLNEHGLEIVIVRAIGFRLYRSRLLARASPIASTPDAVERLLARAPFAPFAPDLFAAARKSARRLP